MSINRFNNHFWGEVGKKCNKAAVFIDEDSVECLHWNGGFASLNKALSIKQFSVFESADSKIKKAVFIINGPVIGNNRSTVQSIIENSSLEYVVIVTNCHPSVQTWSQFPARDWNVDDRTGFDQLEQQVLMWMGNVNYTAEIFYMPLFLISMTPRLFITQSYSKLFPLLDPDHVRAAAIWRSLHPGQSSTSSTGDWSGLPHELQINIRELVSSLHSLLNTLGAKEEIWSLGKLSKQVGDQLESWTPAKNRRKSAENKLSLILIDRTLDVASGVMYGGDTLLCHVSQTLEKLPGHKTDVGVNMTKLFGMCDSSDGNFMLPGSMASPGINPDVEEEEMEAMVFKSERECLGVLFKNLLEKSPKKKLDSPSKKYVNIASIETALKDYVGDYDSILGNLGTVSRAAGAVQCVNVEKVDVRRKKLQSLMSQMTRSMCDGCNRVLDDVTDLIRGRKDSNLRLDDILMLLMFVFSSVDVRDEFPSEEVDRLKSVLGEALLKDYINDFQSVGDVFEALCKAENENEIDEVVALNVVNNVWERLDSLKRSRSDVGRYQSFVNFEGEFNGLLSQLLTDIYHDDRRDVDCLHHHSGGLGAMLRSGLGWLGSAPSKSHPRENPWILVFVLGGVTPREVGTCQDHVSGVGKLSVGGTRLLSPCDTLQMTFINNSLMV